MATSTIKRYAPQWQQVQKKLATNSVTLPSNFDEVSFLIYDTQYRTSTKFMLLKSEIETMLNETANQYTNFVSGGGYYISTNYGLILVKFEYDSGNIKASFQCTWSGTDRNSACVVIVCTR